MRWCFLIFLCLSSSVWASEDDTPRLRRYESLSGVASDDEDSDQDEMANDAGVDTNFIRTRNRSAKIMVTTGIITIGAGVYMLAWGSNTVSEVILFLGGSTTVALACVLTLGYLASGENEEQSDLEMGVS